PLAAAWRKNVRNGGLKDPSYRFELLEVRDAYLLVRHVELCPGNHHEMSMFIMDGLDHSGRVRIASKVKLVRTPTTLGRCLIQRRPVLPVLNDAIQRDPAFAIFGNYSQKLLLCPVSLARLPESPGPLAKHWRGAGEPAIARDGFIGCRA